MLRLAVFASLVSLVSLISGCSGCGADGGNPNNPGTCEGGMDNDGDGYGAGCAAGPDCDDGNPDHHDDCCAAGLPAYGCPCNPATDTPMTCFDGTPEQAATPPCMKGTRSCDPATSTWGACAGEVVPVSEACNLVDDDCDGTIDDGVLSACGDCTPGCTTGGLGSGPFPLDPAGGLPGGVVDVGADGVGLDPNGDIILDDDNIEFHFLWVANDPEGTVSKLDTLTGKEVARYATVTHHPSAVVSIDGANPALVPAWNGGNRPSRTAVDFYGNVWVANRAPGQQPSATKIMNDVSGCKDRNGNGVIETSKDANNDGRINIADPAEFFAENDECIRFTVAMGAYMANDANRYGARALAIDSGSAPGSPGNAWVGLFHEQAFYQLDGETGQKVRRVPDTGALGVAPYGAAIDGVGRLWAPNGCCGTTGIIGINTTNGQVIQGYSVQTGVTGGSYGIAVDQQNKVWLGGWPHAAAYRFDPDNGSWLQINVAGYFTGGTPTTNTWGARGIGADANGNVWLCMHTHAFTNAAVVARINTTTLQSTGTWDLNTFSSGAVVEGTPVGCAVDFDGNIWTVNQYSPGPAGSPGSASRVYVDPVSHEPTANPATGNIVDSFPVGPAPYTYSDFTGFGLRTITRPQGDYVTVHEGCPNEVAHWLGVSWDASVPAGTRIEVYVRGGNDPTTLSGQPLVGPWTVSPADFQAAPGPVPNTRYLQLVFRLISDDRVSTPVLKSFDLKWTCPGPG